MFLTLQSAVREGEKVQDQSLGKVAKAVSVGSLMGPGQFGSNSIADLRGLAIYLETKEKVNARIAAAFTAGARTAYEAVMKPVEGTILNDHKGNRPRL